MVPEALLEKLEPMGLCNAPAGSPIVTPPPGT